MAALVTPVEEERRPTDTSTLLIFAGIGARPLALGITILALDDLRTWVTRPKEFVGRPVAICISEYGKARAIEVSLGYFRQLRGYRNLTEAQIITVDRGPASEPVMFEIPRAEEIQRRRTGDLSRANDQKSQ